ncbi:membrane protein involved in the export of O-antigen and teichoic acid [Halovivax ruber XH-70]|uniref:Membrane protein involved in the export of O-antigen and teichoic acid n=1 Tax=Halovivax ruber (strain DSM 18193 / JCM 13892 / XH-70) TaxID=797302 RepID=L0I7P4_HALRX|nr:oligosaccharide flippase family protein [Halovivax ruber]AGB15610.1 membrane protein involved in the export of O-antigen and teichoic acid [Halovivax ruber XH-70]
MRFGRTAAAYFASQVALSLAGFLATFFIARLLGAAALGTYTVAVAVLFWLKVPTNGITAAINKRVSEGVDRGAYVGGGLGLSIAVAGAISVFVLAFGGYVDRYVGAGVSGLIVVLYSANVLFDGVSASLKGQKKVALAGGVSVVERVGRLLAQVGVILLGYEVAGLVVGHAISLFVAAMLGLALFDVRPRLPTRAQLASLFDYGRYSWLGSLQSQMFGWMDTTVLAFFVASSLIGIYEVAWTLASTLTLISTAVQQTLFPELSDLGTDDRHERIHHFLNEGLVFTGIFVIPGLVGALILGPRLLRIYRPEFSQGATILVILIAARGVAAFGSQFVSGINALDRPDVAFTINGAFVLTNLSLNVVLIRAFGWHGAAVATGLSACLLTVLSYYGLSGLIGRPSIPAREIGLQFVAALAMALVIYGLQSVAPATHYATVGLVVAGAVTYVALLVGLSPRVRKKAVALVPLSDRFALT